MDDDGSDADAVAAAGSSGGKRAFGEAAGTPSKRPKVA